MSETFTTLDARAMQALPERDRAFASSLARAARRGPLSDKQRHWYGKLLDRANGKEPARTSHPLGSLGPIKAMFDKAAEHLKHPSVFLDVQGRKVKVQPTGAKSRFPGALHVTDGGAYGDNTYFGRITPEGTFLATTKADEAITAALARFAQEPAKVAAEYGRLHGHCCFCRRELSDERSTAVGYGETCAANYGLPWGTR